MIVSSVPGCADAARADYDRCVINHEAGNLQEAQTACEAAVRADPKSEAGVAAKTKVEEILVAKAKAQIAGKGGSPPTAKVDVPVLPSGLDVDPTKPLSNACHLENLRRRAGSKASDNPLAAQEGQDEFRRFETNIALDGRWVAFDNARFISLTEQPNGYEVTFDHANVTTVSDNNIVGAEERTCLSKIFVCTFPTDDKSGLAKLAKGSKFVLGAYYAPQHADYMKPVSCRFLREG